MSVSTKTLYTRGALLKITWKKFYMFFIMTTCVTAFAQGNVIESISVIQPDSSSKTVLKIKLKNTIKNPPRVDMSTQSITLDFDATSSEMNSKSRDVAGADAVRSLSVSHSGDTSRVVFNLAPQRYCTLRREIDGIKITSISGVKSKDMSRPMNCAIRLEGDTVALTVDNFPSDESSWSPFGPPTAFEIRAKNIDARTLILVAAAQANLNVVVGDELKNKRLDISETSIEANQLITRAAHDQHLTTRLVNNILMIGSECRLAQNPSFPVLASDRDLVSMNFGNTSAFRVAHDIFPPMLNTIVDATAIDKVAPLTIRVRNATAKDQLIAVATVEGWLAHPLDSGGIRFVLNENLGKCGHHVTDQSSTGSVVANNASAPISGADGAPSFKAASSDSKSVSPERYRACSGTFPPSISCSPLEQYEIEELKPLGYTQSNSSSSRMIFIESVDGGIYWAKEGSYVGRNFGIIKNIGDTGVNIVERIQEVDGTWKDRPATLNFP
ncbi:pilus assembly protein PilP [Solimicrobium silvestre]|uniref:Pilus assembly protein, PilP n=1 Tax=Solimicrobium silvestre TaxID=2099400 RepID=A0A2S9H3M3_9BURK|nr:pilus assembly protein PilP [Solimicrobium silvestre]PRC94579.1 Pilus assembly protein, PilP [Solimicrobium silvestre]